MTFSYLTKHPHRPLAALDQGLRTLGQQSLQWAVHYLISIKAKGLNTENDRSVKSRTQVGRDKHHIETDEDRKTDKENGEDDMDAM